MFPNWYTWTEAQIFFSRFPFREVTSIDFPMTQLMDETGCYQQLVAWLHPDGLHCPRCGQVEARIHRHHLRPVLDYRCKTCGRVYNAFTGTAFQKTHRRPSELVLLIRGIATGVSTARLARELGRNRPRLLELRHRLQARAQAGLETSALPEDQVEADEMCKNAGEKGRKHRDAQDPPRRANKGQGHGSCASDRPPILGVVGRRRKRLRLRLAKRLWAVVLVGFVVATTLPRTTVYTDDWGAYQQLTRAARRHEAVSHEGPHTSWAQDRDGDGIREAHCNTMEGIWTGLRILLAAFRGVSKWYQEQYVAIFQWAFNTKQIRGAFVRALLAA
jgi:transposase-like protein